MNSKTAEEQAMRGSRWAKLLALFALAALVSQPVLACTICKYSPNGFGFCRETSYYGYDMWDCSANVVDPVSGRTDCDFGQAAFGECDWRGQDWPYPPGGAPTGGGGGGGGGDCWWTDLSGGCILYF
jgi:hypothetical protein